MDTNKLVTVSIIIQNNIDSISQNLKDVHTLLKNNFLHFEMLIIDNGSNRINIEKIKNEVKSFSKTRLIILSKEYEENIAITAALENCIGDYVVTIDIETDPIDLIPLMIEKCSNGFDYIVGQHTELHARPFFYRILSWIFYRIFNLFSKNKVEMNWSNYICFSRKIVNSIIQIKDRVRFIKFLKTEMGYSYDIILYKKSIVKNNKNQFKNLKFAIEVFISSSGKLLNFASFISIVIFMLNFIYFFYSLAVYIFKVDVAKGWTSTALILSVMFGALFFVLFIIIEYLSIIYKETKKGPLYYISAEINNPDLFANFNKKNITKLMDDEF